tara:strand:+ start:662 stop:3379 length:2718 start_codon:yes stop_codon:yes gene_type:complete
MFGKIFRAVFGTKNNRVLKRMGKLVAKINALESDYENLSIEQIQQKTTEFQQRYQEGETLDQLLPDAFANVRVASQRTMDMRHFDVQLIGGIALHEGKIAEMRTGEGKTLMATLSTYLHALTGDGVHIVTVNDYLAERDAEWMRPLYEGLGLTVGVILSGQYAEDKQASYRCDITYGTNNEFGFDFLRDNMALRREDKVQRGLAYAVVDEVDSILIDEARTPLIISGQADDSSVMYQRINALVGDLNRQEEEGDDVKETGDFTVDEKSRQVELTESGHDKVEQLMLAAGLLQENDSLYAAGNLGLLHHVSSALRAYSLFQKNIEYIVEDNQVVLIDEHTGRTMAGRRLSDGLHQALEAKEGVDIQSESQTLASTTFQNFFRMYDTLAGMTGTADTEAFEFHQIYNLPVVVIPPNRNVQRKDLNDLVYLTVEDKFDAIVDDVKELQEKQVPVLVGTASIETSELMSERFKKAGIEHNVLNAKFHEKEAEIIEGAGRPGAITIATNMAGRGTDIVLGGNLKAELLALGVDASAKAISDVNADWQQRHELVLERGGLHIIGTERHESRRIDNQLRGRAGRQGDPGMSRFYLSLEDSLMRIFASERVRNFMQALGMENGEAIEHRMVSNAIEKAQRKVEGRNFDIRKQLLEYDDVSNDQRQIIYSQRNELLEADDIADVLVNVRYDVCSTLVSGFIPPQSIEEQWDVAGLERKIEADFGLRMTLQQWLNDDDTLHEEALREKIHVEFEAAYQAKSERIGDVMREIETQVMLQIVDQLWKEHLQNMDQLRQGIGLRAYAQKNPKQEYKRESFEMFESLLDNIKHDVAKVLARVEPISREQMEAQEQQRRVAQERQKLQLQHAEANAMGQPAPATDEPKAEPVRAGRKVGRNDICPCGSGKKFKQCHGKLA